MSNDDIKTGVWSKQGLSAVNETKKSILRKKIILNIIVESYSTYDKIFRYLHMFFALTAPVIAFINQMITGSDNQTRTVTLVLSSIVAGMIKLKDYLKFDKTKDRAKQQTVKYGQLYQRIDRELRKPNGKRQNEEDFIYWTGREFNNIEVSDPDLPHSLKTKYIALCKEKGIPYEEDLAMLQDLINYTAVEEVKNTAIAVFIEKGADVVADAVDSNINGNKDNALCNHNILDTSSRQNNLDDNIENPLNQSYPIKMGVVSHLNQLSTSPESMTSKPERTLKNRQRSESDEKERIEYREQIKTLDTSKDLQWAIDRLNTLES